MHIEIFMRKVQRVSETERAERQFSLALFRLRDKFFDGSH